MKEKSEHQREVEAESEHLLGTVWYGVSHKEFTLITLGPLKRCDGEADGHDYTHLTDDAGNFRWWPHFGDGKVNKGETVFKERAAAIEYLAQRHRYEKRKHQKYLDFHTDALAELLKEPSESSSSAQKGE